MDDGLCDISPLILTFSDFLSRTNTPFDPEVSLEKERLLGWWISATSAVQIAELKVIKWGIARNESHRLAMCSVPRGPVRPSSGEDGTDYGS